MVVLVRLWVMAMTVWRVLRIGRETVHKHLRRHVEILTMWHMVRWWLHSHIHRWRRHMSRVARHRRTTLWEHLGLPNTRNKLTVIWRRHVWTATVRSLRHLVVGWMHPIALHVAIIAIWWWLE